MCVPNMVYVATCEYLSGEVATSARYEGTRCGCLPKSNYFYVQRHQDISKEPRASRTILKHIMSGNTQNFYNFKKPEKMLKGNPEYPSNNFQDLESGINVFERLALTFGNMGSISINKSCSSDLSLQKS